MDDLIIMSYEEFKKNKKVYDDLECTVGYCHEPGLYEGGDARCYCPMCEVHAGIKLQYDYYKTDLEYKKKIRSMWYS